MSRHVTYRGVTIDMDSIRRENENVPAIGNYRVNAKGDQIKNGQVTKTADQIARENHRVQSTIVSSGLKGKMPEPITQEVAQPKKVINKSTKVKKEVELPNGDIVLGENDE